MQEQITAQEIVNTVYFAMKAQGRQSADKNGNCKYRGPDGCACAIGKLITDEEYDEKMDAGDDDGSTAVRDIAAIGLIPGRFRPHLLLMSDLQDCHDEATMDFWPQFKAAFIETCAGYNLTVPENE